MRWKSHVRCGAGEKLEITPKIYLSLFDCILWDGVAKSTSEYCKKGDIVGVKGRIQSEVVEKEDGSKKYYLNVIAERVTFLSGNSSKKEINDQILKGDK